jgi:hypothetical protein
MRPVLAYHPAASYHVAGTDVRPAVRSGLPSDPASPAYQPGDSFHHFTCARQVFLFDHHYCPRRRRSRHRRFFRRPTDQWKPVTNWSPTNSFRSIDAVSPSSSRGKNAARGESSAPGDREGERGCLA